MILTKRKNWYQVSGGNLIVLASIPYMMNDMILKPYIFVINTIKN